MDSIARRNLLLAGAVAGPAVVSALTKESKADTIFTGFQYPAQSQYPVFTAPGNGRATPIRFGDTLNALDFGADPTGARDSTVAFQTLFDTAFGPITAPNGAANAQANKDIYIPNGNYQVSAPAQQTITAAAVDVGTGKMKVSVGSTANLKTGYYVYLTGASGSDGTGLGSFAFVFNGPHPIQVLNSTDFLLTLPGTWPATGTWVSGGVVNTSALHITALLGARISGAGRYTTNINCTNGPVLIANGWGYGRLENMGFSAAQGTSCVDFNFDGIVSQSTQSMTIQNCGFGLAGPPISSPTGTEKAAFMVGWGQASLCSEFSVINCDFTCPNGDGYYIGGFNALGHTILGGSFHQCINGVHVGAGCAGAIIGTAFELGSANTGFDIVVDNSAGDCMVIHGVRSESKNFAQIQAGPGVHISGVAHLASGGTFVFYSGLGTTPPATSGSGCCDIQDSFTGGKVVAANGWVSLSGTTSSAGLNALLNNSFGTVGQGGITACNNIGPLTFANLPTPNAYIAGLRMIQTDAPSNATYGQAASAGTGSPGPNIYLPVYVKWDGTTATWVYG